MCGRYTLTLAGLVPDFFEISETRINPRFNIAPTQEAPVVRLSESGERELKELRWGLVPHWFKGPPKGSLMINARSEGLAEKPAFRDAFRKRRCLVPADGFYEWAKAGPGKQPYYFRMKDRTLFAFAGLWDRCRLEGEVLETFTIVTCPPNSAVAPFHDRMPVILPRSAFDGWLKGPPAAPDVGDLLVPCDPELMESFAVSTLVNSPTNDRPECIRPLS